MQTLTVEPTVADALDKLNGLIEVRDENGTVLGFYAPVPPEHAARYAETASNGASRPKSDVVDHLNTLESR